MIEISEELLSILMMRVKVQALAFFHNMEERSMVTLNRAI